MSLFACLMMPSHGAHPLVSGGWSEQGTVFSLFERPARCTPKLVVLHDLLLTDACLSYGALLDRSISLAQAFAASGCHLEVDDASR